MYGFCGYFMRGRPRGLQRPKQRTKFRNLMISNRIKISGFLRRFQRFQMRFQDFSGISTRFQDFKWDFRISNWVVAVQTLPSHAPQLFGGTGPGVAYEWALDHVIMQFTEVMQQYTEHVKIDFRKISGCQDFQYDFSSSVRDFRPVANPLDFMRAF